jgi:hypothetical protein
MLRQIGGMFTFAIQVCTGEAQRCNGRPCMVPGLREEFNSERSLQDPIRTSALGQHSRRQPTALCQEDLLCYQNDYSSSSFSSSLSKEISS